MKKGLSKYFSDTFREAAMKFCTASGGLSQIHYHPTERDAKGNKLSVDVVWQGSRNPRAILLVTSGLHGVEGFAGSAIQLKAITEKSLGPVPNDMAVVYVHGLNPYGFEESRRVNEDNVDLNRNFLTWSGDTPKAHRLNGKLQSILMPERWNWTNFHLKSALLLARHGLKELQACLQGGQYDTPDGVFFGGKKAAWSNGMVRQIFNQCAQAEYIAHIDIHTGLGPRGEGEVMLLEPRASEAGKRAIDWYGEEKVKSTSDGSSVSAHVSGSINYVYDDAAFKNSEVTVVALEFGTVSPFKVLKAMAYDNWVHAKGKTGKEREKARSMMRDAFCPRDPEWEEKVLDRGIEVLQQAKKGLEKALQQNPKP